MYKLEFLKKENDLNKIIRANKKDKNKMNILFVSLWDEWCEELVFDQPTSSRTEHLFLKPLSRSGHR